MSRREDHETPAGAEAVLEADRPARGRWALLVLAVGAMLGVGVLAGPVRGEPGCEPAPSALVAGESGCAGADTAVTPVAKPSAYWRQVGGVPFPGHGEGSLDTVAESATAVGSDLFAVEFRDATHGFAGGAACLDAPARGASGRELDEHLARCLRAPVIYRYTEAAGPPRWEEMRLGERPGFVAAIAWLGPDRALAVGGDASPGRSCPGCGYPRREDGADVTAPSYADPAGNARAWWYESGSWTEIEGLPSGMSALTAVGCREGDGWCVAGGLGQLWSWRDGRFDEGYGAGLPGKVNGRFAFRVRDLQLLAPGQSQDPTPLAYPEGYAVTGGCCATTPDANVPAVLAYDAESDAWNVHPAQTAAARGLDSLYSVTVARTTASNPRPIPGVVLASGGPPRAVEPPSATAQMTHKGASNDLGDVSWLPFAVSRGDRPLGSVRLVSGDGTSVQPVASSQPPDLAVGELRSSGRAVAYDRLASPSPSGYSSGDPLSGRLPSADADRLAESQRSYKLTALPSYALNAVDMPDPVVAGGLAWAVGDRGAIVKRSPTPEEQLAPPAPAPKLGPSRPGRFPDDSPYAAFRPLGGGGRAGEVPPLSARPRDVEGWGFEAWGSPDAAPPPSLDGERVSSIAMSRDGREGWAVGPGKDGGRLTLYRFDGTAWRRCDADGVRAGDVLAPDDACAGLAALRSRGLALSAIAPVDPGSERFEAVAVGWLPADAGQQVTAVIVRYRDGRWSVEEAPSDPAVGFRYRLRSVAFTGPDDGWAYGASAVEESDVVMLRFTEGRWSVCGGLGACDDEAGLLPDRRYVPPANGQALTAVGDRVFLAGTREVFNTSLPEKYYPLVLTHRRGGRWEDADGLDAAGPGKTPETPGDTWMTSFAIAATEEGRLEGWARLAPQGPSGGGSSNATLRLVPGRGWESWLPAARADALRDHPIGAELRAIVTAGDGARAFMTAGGGRFLRFDGAAGRWRVLAAPFDPSGANPSTAGNLQAMAPDGRGGLWLLHDRDGSGPFFHRYTDRPHRPVFDDVPQPFTGERIRHLAAGDDGTVWLAGDGGRLARYDRLAGWSTLRIPGWDREARASAVVTALAVAPDGTGVAVGEGGRIANLTPRGTQLNPAAGRLCSAVSSAPCATGETLRAVDVAPDGSAMAGGDRASVLWRPAQGAFRAITAPPIDPRTRITGVALPTPDRAWIATSQGDVFAGHLDGDGWNWGQTSENVAPGGEPLSAGDEGAQALRAIAVDASGRGYAVGDGGVVLERTGDPVAPWRRVALGVSDDLTAVALAEGGGDGALIGAKAGAIWTWAGGRFQLARAASVVDGYTAGADAQVSGLAIVPGTDAGVTEAWAALDGPGLGGALLHYASDPDDPLLAPVKPAESLPDAPAPREGELSFVAFGKSDCANSRFDPCPGASGTDALSDVVSRRIVRAVTAATRKPGGPRFAIFTGDANDHGGDVTRASRPALLNQWVDLVARPLDEATVPVLGAIGVLDLSEAGNCVLGGTEALCVSSTQTTHAGANVFWRQAMVKRVGQDGGPQAFGELRYRPVGDDLLPSTPDVAAPGGTPDPVPSSVPTGGARTHYAVDVLRAGRPLLRLVFVDNSLGSLRASDPLQQPPEPRGQLAWLDRVLSSRPRGARAVVVSTAPSYSYEAQTVTDVADDGASFEEIVLRHRVSAVVSGRLGWNALYYALAPGLHCPEPGGSYPERPPTSPTGCEQASRVPGTGISASRGLADALQGLEAPSAPRTSSQGLGSAVPFVISSSAGGKLARASGAGYWHGYSVIRLDASGDPAKTVVEQRPILDWLLVTAHERRLRPGQKLTLNGVGREPPAADTPPRYHRLIDPSITHRYDLVLADPDKPWLPYRNSEEKYVAMSDRYPNCAVACVDAQTGEVSTGEGTDHRVYAIGLLSAGELTATYPLAFEPSATPKAPPAAAHTAALRGLSDLGPRSGLPGSQTARVAPSSAPAHLDLPAVPGLVPMPSHGGPPPQPPTPHVITTSPPSHAASAAEVARAPPGLLDAPRVSPIPPSVPPAQPAPKASGQRDETFQRQAALADFDDDTSLAIDDVAEAEQDEFWVDLAEAPSVPRGAEATRRTLGRSDLPMTALRAADQPSAWTRGALYGGGLTVAALSLGCAWLALKRRRVRTATALVPSRPSSRGNR